MMIMIQLEGNGTPKEKRSSTIFLADLSINEDKTKEHTLQLVGTELVFSAIVGQS
jgi:hypothetical protein